MFTTNEISSDWSKLESAAQHLGSDADFDYEVEILNNVVIPESAFAGYDDGCEWFNVPRIGVIDAYEVRRRGWKFWTDIDVRCSAALD
jgi:hypothetical protein